MKNSDLHVVIGSGPLGLAVTRLLLSLGRRVRVINKRGQSAIPAGVEVMSGDIADPDFGRKVTRSAYALYLCAKPPYHKMAKHFQPIMDGAIAAAADSHARIIYADNLYAYGPVVGPLTEDLPYAATGRKGSARARLAEQLMAAHAEGRVLAAVGRASDFYGPGVIQSAVGERVFGFALAGRAASVTGNPDTPHTYTFIDDFARGLVTLAEHDEALGDCWHIPSAKTISTRRFIELIFQELGRPARIQVAPRWLLLLLGIFNPLVRELPEILYQTEQPFIVDHTKFEHTFGANTTPHVEAIRTTLGWYRKWQAKAGPKTA